MEKKLYELTIDPEFRDMIPPLSEEEYRMLEESIVRDGCDTPLAVWNGIIVDGHNRYVICHKHGIAFAIDEREFADRDAAVFWMLEHQLARRNLNSYQRGELALKFEPLIKKRVAENLKTSTGGNNPRPCANLHKAGLRTTGEIGKIAGVSARTISKVRELEEKADSRVKEQLRNGDISINRAYNDIKNMEHRGETRICTHCGQEKPYSEFDIPSNSRSYSSLCRDCVKKARQAQAEEDKQAPPPESGIVVKDGKLAHVPTQLEDDPELFVHVLSLLESATRAYIATFETALDQLQPSMMTQENTETIRRMTKDTKDTVDNALRKRLSGKNKEEQ